MAGSVFSRLYSPGALYCASGATGTMAAALAADAPVYALHSVAANTRRVRILTVALEYTTIVAFTVPVTAGRKLVLGKGTGTSAGGSAVAAPVTKRSAGEATSTADVSRIATTATLTGMTPTAVYDEMTLVSVGAAGAEKDVIFDFSDFPIELAAGESFLISNGPAAMDAAGTWQLGVTVTWAE